MGERLEALAAQQAALGQRLDALVAQVASGAGPEERLQAMAGQLLGLVRDKNATLETALAGLDQLRARMRALEQMGEPAEARALLDGLAQRLGGIEAAQAAAAAATEARLAALDGTAPPRPTSPAPSPTSASGWRASRRAATPGSREASKRRSPASPRSRPASACSTAPGPRGARR